jgi:sugar porter (SP) family MFS transporter
MTDTQAGAEPAWRYGYIWAITLSAAMGGLLFGWDWVVIGGAKPFFERYFDIGDNPSLSGWANSCALLGCFVGATVGGACSDRFGRKPLLVGSAVLFAVTSIGIAVSTSFPAFIAWRIAGGVAIGLASSLSPLYIAEIAPPRVRGALVAVNQLTIVVGVLAAQLINWWIVRDLPPGASEAFIAESWFGQTSWRIMFAVTAIPSIVFVIAMLAAPESPRWLAARGRKEAAERVLSRLGGPGYAHTGLKEIDATLRGGSAAKLADLLHPSLRRALVLGVTLAVFQQWCGINVIFNYAEEIFQAAGFDISTVLANIAWTGSVNLVFTLLALRLVDRAGRRPLMLAGAGLLTLIYAALATAFAMGVGGVVALVLVLAAIAVYATTLAPVTWVVISEIFPNRVRGTAIAVAVGALWLASFALTFTFPVINAALGASGAFFLYAFVCAAGFVFVLKAMPETKGRALEDIEAGL